jgi:DNA-binding LacI/PurR family transcriptional regulator
MPRRDRPTIIDVAARAGVSKSLVSLVLRGAPNVSDERRRAVLEAAAELGYRPNAMARSLVRRRSDLVGVMVSDLHNPFFTAVIDGIAAAAQANGYRALLNSGDRTSDGERDAVETLLQLRADGLILVGTVVSEELIDRVAADTHIVLASRQSTSRLADSIVTDDATGCRLAVDHLVALGHRRIGHVTGGSGAGAAERLRGFQAAMDRNGLLEHAMVADGSFTEAGGIAGVEALLSAAALPTAVFAANDQAAIGALRALASAGLRVPQDVSVVGYDDTYLAAFEHIDLTSVHQAAVEMGRESARLLIERTDGGRTKVRHVTMAPGLTVRGSTSRPRSRTRSR